MSHSSSASNQLTGNVHFIIIHNKNAGRTHRRVRARIAKFYTKQEVSFEIQSSSHIVWEQVRRKASGYAALRFVVVGGDGTLRRTFEALWQNKLLHCPVAFVPMGSGNLTAYSFRLPFDIEQALARSIHGSPTSVDLGILNNEHLFFIGAGFGLLADNAVLTERAMKLRYGIFAYLLQAPAILWKDFRRARFEITLALPDGSQLKKTTHSFVVLNHLNLSAVRPRRGILPDDGLLDFFTLHNNGITGLVRAAFDLFMIKGDSPYLHHVRAHTMHCTLTGFTGRVHVDGDPLERVGGTLSFSTLKRAGLFIL